MYGGYGGYGGSGGYGGGGYGGGGSEMRSDMWIQQNVPGGLNSKYSKVFLRYDERNINFASFVFFHYRCYG